MNATYLHELFLMFLQAYGVYSETGGSGAASTVMQDAMKRELSHKAKLSIYWSVYILTPNNGHKLWVITERMRL